MTTNAQFRFASVRLSEEPNAPSLRICFVAVGTAICEHFVMKVNKAANLRTYNNFDEYLDYSNKIIPTSRPAVGETFWIANKG